MSTLPPLTITPTRLDDKSIPPNNTPASPKHPVGSTTNFKEFAKNFKHVINSSSVTVTISAMLPQFFIISKGSFPIA